MSKRNRRIQRVRRLHSRNREVSGGKRTRGAKSDRIDAVRAARTALAREQQAEPRARGLREALRQILVTRPPHKAFPRRHHRIAKRLSAETIRELALKGYVDGVSTNTLPRRC